LSEAVPTYLVCSGEFIPGAEQGNCSQCSSMIWPTRGTLEIAEKRKFTPICVRCYEKLEDPIFGGVMHHGEMVPPAEALAFLLNFADYLARKRRV
jgi:hypothetical protein